MKKINFLILVTITAAILSETYGNALPNNKKLIPPAAFIRLRSFSIYALKALHEMSKNYEMQQNLLEEKNNQEARSKNERMLYEEIERRRLFQKNFGSLHSSKSFLSDFHADRYF